MAGKKLTRYLIEIRLEQDSRKAKTFIQSASTPHNAIINLLQRIKWRKDVTIYQIKILEKYDI